MLCLRLRRVVRYYLFFVKRRYRLLFHARAAFRRFIFKREVSRFAAARRLSAFTPLERFSLFISFCVSSSVLPLGVCVRVDVLYRRSFYNAARVPCDRFFGANCVQSVVGVKRKKGACFLKILRLAVDSFPKPPNIVKILA